MELCLMTCMLKFLNMTTTTTMLILGLNGFNGMHQHTMIPGRQMSGLDHGTTTMTMIGMATRPRHMMSGMMHLPTGRVLRRTLPRPMTCPKEIHQPPQNPMINRVSPRTITKEVMVVLSVGRSGIELRNVLSAKVVLSLAKEKAKDLGKARRVLVGRVARAKARDLF